MTDRDFLWCALNLMLDDEEALGRKCGRLGLGPGEVAAYRDAHPGLSTRDLYVHIVGDAHKVGNLRTVIWRAWDVCMKL